MFRILERMKVRPTDAQWWFEQHDRFCWTYARTMPQAPHSYIWKDREIPAQEYDRMFGAVKTFGEPGKYWDRTQLYLINHERNIRYWLMDRHHYTCLILNMATDGKTYGVQDAPSTVNDIWAEYDEIAPWWDDVYRELHDFDKSVLWKLIYQNVHLPKPTLLDLGAGTGGSLDARIAPSHQTTAVDPSQGMLNDLVLKFPRIGKVVPSTVADYLQGPESGEHDLVVASLGSASYLTSEEVRGAHELSKHLTVLSFYKRTPSHREDVPDTHVDAWEAALDLPGAREMEHGNFVHVVARGHG